MSSNGSIVWYEIACWAFPIKVLTKGTVEDPLLRAVHSLRENFHMSDVDIQAHIGMPIGMIQSAINYVDAEDFTNKDLERSNYLPPQDGWVFWCPATKELLPEIWTSALQDCRHRLKAQYIQKPYIDKILRAVKRLQHSSFVKLRNECGEHGDILKLEVRRGNPVKQILHVPVEFRGHTVICWKPQYYKTQLPDRSLSKINVFEQIFLEKDVYRTSKDDFDSKQNTLLLQETEYNSMRDFDNDIRSWCSEQFLDLWRDGSSQVEVEIFSTRKQAQVDFYFNNGWQSRGQKWGTLLEWSMKRIARGLIRYCDDKYAGEIEHNLSRVKAMSSYYHKFFTKRALPLKDYLRKLRNNFEYDNCSIDSYSQIFCLALATDTGWEFGSDINHRFPDFIKNLTNARDNRNLCMHVKQDVCEVELFVEQMVYVSKVTLYFDQQIAPKLAE